MFPRDSFRLFIGSGRQYYISWHWVHLFLDVSAALKPEVLALLSNVCLELTEFSRSQRSHPCITVQLFAVRLHHSTGKQQSGLFRVGVGVLGVCRGPAGSPESLGKLLFCTCCSEHSEKLFLTSRDNLAFPGISFKSEPCDIFTMDFNIACNLHSLSTPTPCWAANTN